MIAGLCKVGTGYGWFGPMGRAWMFERAINDNNDHLSQALDRIPAVGVVSRKDYLAYIDQFKQALPKGGRLATATRLLAMKRPDTFVCISKANRKGLCCAFEISSRFGAGRNWAERYWDSIILKIQASTWWKPQAHGDVIEGEVWDARAAFLDSLFYDYRLKKETAEQLNGLECQ